MVVHFVVQVVTVWLQELLLSCRLLVVQQICGYAQAVSAVENEQRCLAIEQIGRAHLNLCLTSPPLARALSQQQGNSKPPPPSPMGSVPETLPPGLLCFQATYAFRAASSITASESLQITVASLAVPLSTPSRTPETSTPSSPAALRRRVTSTS